MKFTVEDSKSIADFMTLQDFDWNNQWVQREVTEMTNNAYSAKQDKNLTGQILLCTK